MRFLLLTACLIAGCSRAPDTPLGRVYGYQFMINDLSGHTLVTGTISSEFAWPTTIGSDAEWTGQWGGQADPGAPADSPIVWYAKNGGKRTYEANIAKGKIYVNFVPNVADAGFYAVLHVESEHWAGDCSSVSEAGDHLEGSIIITRKQ